uniref:Gaba receptor binding protein n=1 Tax=Rhipicephalus zambeziensis TaxID=60191 RepID=A0A224YWP8_9ACAR
MTRTYSDPEALTRLLEEKERDLELAAHIGQGLLREKRELACRTDALEAELLQAQESLTQLRHELALKASLLQVYTAQEEADAALPSPTDDDDVPVSTLTRKIHELEKENSKLKAESQSQLSHLEEEEKKEMQLIRDCVRQLSDVTRESSHLQEELCRRTEVNLRQQQEILTLNAQLNDMQRYAQSLRAEAEELRAQLALSRGLQEQQSEELLEARARYLDLKEAFLELQAQLRHRSQDNDESRHGTAIWGGRCTSGPLSLACELQACIADQGDQAPPTGGGGTGDGFPLKPACSPWSQSEESEESDCNDSQYSSLSSLGLSPRKGRKGSCRRLPQSPWGAPLARPFRLSDKLLMVKPIEGSETLKQWQRLATPGLGDLFEDQGSGVRLKGGLPVQPPLEAPRDSLGDFKGLAGKAAPGIPDGVALRCWVQRPGWEPEAPWLRLQACLSKLSSSSGESRMPSVLLRTQQQLQEQQDKPVPGTPPSSPVMQRRGVTRLLRSYRASSRCSSPARPSKLGIVCEAGGTAMQPCTTDSLQACNSLAVSS